MGLARKRILLTTFGSLGDLHPMLALARGLQARGAHVKVASSELHGLRVEAAGLAFVPTRPNVTPEDAVLTRRLLNRHSGAEVLVRELMMQPLRQTYADLEQAARGMDLLIAGEVVYAAPLVAERLKLPWVSVLLSPFALLSALDPAVFPNLPWPEAWRVAPAGVRRLLLRLARQDPRLVRRGRPAARGAGVESVEASAVRRQIRREAHTRAVLAGAGPGPIGLAAGRVRRGRLL